MELPWLYRASRNLTIDFFRKGRRNVSLGEQDFGAHSMPSAEEGLFHEELMERMFRVAASCGSQYETLLHLLTETRIGQTEMVKILGKSERTVRRMMEKLFNSLEAELKDWRAFIDL